MLLNEKDYFVVAMYYVGSMFAKNGITLIIHRSKAAEQMLVPNSSQKHGTLECTSPKNK